MRIISNEEEYMDKVIENLINDLDLISKHEKIKDIRIIDDMFEIETNHLNIFTEQGDEYEGGEYTIKIRMDRVSVLFEGNNRRKSYWSVQDPPTRKWKNRRSLFWKLINHNSRIMQSISIIRISTGLY